jgi:asparagine synthase (glutamine-hydrolysing)
MCGIAGYINYSRDAKASREVTKKMTDIIRHRGPDGEGFHVNNNIALGHRRLSIIDLFKGSQPMYSQNKTIVIVFNGEIYNYIELKEELRTLGHKFYTDSDTEVVISAYQQWGTGCQSKFNGMWAFALWDEVKQELFISRDRIGEKPLYFSEQKNAFVFASEIKSLFEYGINAEPNTEIIQLYLAFSYIPAPYTGFKNIFKLKPGHYIIVKDGHYKEFKFWDLPEIDEQNMYSDRNYVNDSFTELFKDSVSLRMRSDVPFGAFLSGGLDSSSVVSVMSEISPFRIETFHMSFNEKHFDESALALEVSQKFKANHHVHTVSPESFEESLDLINFHFDEPFGDSSAIPTGYISKFAAKKVKMVLTGDGGDEVLSGYNSYQGVKLSARYQKLPFLLRRSIPKVLQFGSIPLKGNARYKVDKIRRACLTAEMPFNEKMLNKIPNIDISLIHEIYNGKEQIKVEDFFSDFISKCTYKDDFYKLMYFDLKLNLPEDMLAKVDRMSMANSLETRLPFLDHRLIEFMVNVDKNIKMQGLERKSVLRQTIGKTLPDSLLNSPKKGFAIPLREWFKKDSFSNKLTDLANMHKAFNKDIIDSIIEKNKQGKEDNGNFLWMLFVMNKWLVK